MLALFFDGLLWGVWLLGVVIPTLLVLTAVGVTVYRQFFKKEYIDAFTLVRDFPPDLPTAEPEEMPVRHRSLTTIVRPPKVYRKEEDDDDEKGQGS